MAPPLADGALRLCGPQPILLVIADLSLGLGDLETKGQGTYQETVCVLCDHI